MSSWQEKERVGFGPCYWVKRDSAAGYLLVPGLSLVDRLPVGEVLSCDIGLAEYEANDGKSTRGVVFVVVVVC